MRHEAANPQQAMAEPANGPVETLSISLAELLARPARVQPLANELLIGRVCALADDGRPLVTWPTGSAAPALAASLVAVTEADVGRAVALGFPAGEGQPLILGLVWNPVSEPLTSEVDGQHVEIEAEASITLRCGQASITLTADGQVLLRGSYVSSHSTGTQRIKGAAVRIN